MEPIKYSDFKVSENTAKWLRLYKRLDGAWNEMLAVINDLYNDSDKERDNLYEYFKPIEKEIFSQMESSMSEITGFVNCPKNVI